MVKARRVNPRENKIDAPFGVVVERLLATKPQHSTAKKKAAPRKRAKKKG